MTSSLAAAKLGEVDCRKLMGATREAVETFIDANAVYLTGKRSLSPESIHKILCPLVIGAFKRCGFELEDGFSWFE